MKNKGVLYAIGAYLAWGFLPIYWKALQQVPALEILSHRIVWSLVILLLLLAHRRLWRWIQPALKDKRILLIFLLTACILAINWGTYIWAVNAERVVETSLGYFINPLISVMLGVFFLHERLRPWQWATVALAAVGVAYLTVIHGTLPWVALTLAISFGFYGLIRKTAPLGALEGLVLETAWLFIPALVFLVYLEASGRGSFAHFGWQTTLLLIGTGLATAVPLLWFGMAARLIPLTSIGILQYLSPTCQFLLGVFLFNEPFNQAQLWGFSLIWLSLIIYSGEGIYQARKRMKPVGTPVS